MNGVVVFKLTVSSILDAVYIWMLLPFRAVFEILHLLAGFCN
jgi:hypothetical protein